MARKENQNLLHHFFFKCEEMVVAGGTKKFKNFPCRDQSCLTIVYKFLAKMHQNVPIPCHGAKNLNLIPCQELLARENLIFLTQGILARPCHVTTYPAKQCRGKKRRALEYTYRKPLSVLNRDQHWRFLAFAKLQSWICSFTFFCKENVPFKMVRAKKVR